MATKAQIKANRENAEKSTGPRTAEGKAAVAQNALKHGLFGRMAVINGEDQGQFDFYRDTLLGELSPVGAMECILAERIVSVSWRVRRAERMQNQAIDEMIEGMKPTPIDHYIRKTTAPFLRGSEQKFKEVEPSMALGRVAKNDCANYRILERLMLYERRIESSMFRTIRELERLQLVREVKEAHAEEQSAQESPSAQRRKGDLKKQSQFAPALMGTTSYVRKDYDDKAPAGARENKAKQSQSPAFGRKSEARNPKSETTRTAFR